MSLFDQVLNSAIIGEGTSFNTIINSKSALLISSIISKAKILIVHLLHLEGR